MNNIVDILYGASACYSFKKSKINNLVIEFDTIFSVANLDNIDNYILTYPNELFDDYNFSKEIETLNNLTNTHKVRIWCSKKDADSYILLCYMCYYLKDKTNNISVIYSEDYNENYNTPAIIREEEFIDALKHEYKLTIDDINELANSFINIKDIPTDIRIMKDNKISLENYDYYNDIILNIIKDKELKISNVVGQLLTYYDHLVDIIYCYLIQRMIESGIIKVVEDSDRFFDNIISLK